MTKDAIPTRVRTEDWPHGLSCGECDHVFTDGETYHQKIEAMFEDGTPVLVIVCADCALGAK
jgi:hypothetical protein